jgi:hypothetical protein
MVVKPVTFIFCIFLLVGSLFAQQADFTGFVSTNYSEATIPDGYIGLHWSNFTAFHSPGCSAVKYEFSYTGYCHVADATGKYDMAYLYGEYGYTRLGIISADQPFVLKSAVIAAAWNNDVQLTVTGYLHGSMQYMRLIPLQTGFEDCTRGPSCQTSADSFPTPVTFGWLVDAVTFSATGGYSDGIGEVIFPGWHQPHVVFSSLVVQKSEPEIPIDVKPGSNRNPINLDEEGVTPIAILGNALLAPDNIDFSTIRAGRNGASPFDHQPEFGDVNNDGGPDLVFHVETKLLGILPEDRELCIVGKTYQGAEFRGCDVITVIAKKQSPGPSKTAVPAAGRVARSNRPSR